MPIYTCPISLDTPRAPVITNEGITYDFVSIARSLLRENTDHHADFNPTLDPTTHRNIDTLIYNRAVKELNDAQMDTVLPLSHEEQTEIASLYTQLISRYPTLKIWGMHALEGMLALIGAPMPTVQLVPQPAVIVESLWFAAENGHLNVVTALLAEGTDFNQATIDGGTPLHIAAQNGHLSVVTALLAAGADFNRAMTNGETPLFIAAQNGHLSVVTALLGAGADFNQATTDGKTPLCMAAHQGHLGVVEALLAAGADFNQATTDEGVTPLFISARNGHLGVVAAFLDAGADFNQATTSGVTPLFASAYQGHLSVVTALLAAGADFNQAMTNGATPLFIAAQYGHLSVVEALLVAGANTNSEMTDGATPLYTAILFGHYEVVQALQRHQHATMAHPPISLATQQGYPAFVKALLSDETVRDYYLNQIIIKPELMRNAFTQNTAFFTELVTHRNALWARIRESAHFNLSPDEHRGLLRTILDSRQEPNEALRHPLYALFNTPQLQGRGLVGFYNRITHTILDDIQAHIDIDLTLDNQRSNRRKPN